MADVVCLGEILVDLVPAASGDSLATAHTLIKAAGGAPANVAVGLARLGIAAAFLGAVGADGFGRFLADTLAVEGVDVSGLRTSDVAPTALAAVSLAADGERDFVFYGHPAAHTTFAPGDLDEPMLRAAKVLHVGSISLAVEPMRSATLRAVAIARESGVLVSFDPNLRLALWPDAAAATEAMRLGLAQADIVKIADDEVEFLAGGCDLVEGARALWHPGLRLMAVTRGAREVTWLTAEAEGERRGFAVEAVDTTGAGDAFTAALLAAVVRDGEALFRPGEPLDRALRLASAAGALTTTGRGAVPSLPDLTTVRRFLAERGHPKG